MKSAYDVIDAIRMCDRDGSMAIIESRDAEWQARVDAACREGWQSGVRSMAAAANGYGVAVQLDAEALIAQGPK